MAVITLGAFSFRPSLLTTVAAVAGIVLTFFLGEWQIGRADFKQGLQDRQDALAREPVVSIGVAPLAAIHQRRDAAHAALEEGRDLLVKVHLPGGAVEGLHAAQLHGAAVLPNNNSILHLIKANKAMG